MGSWFLLTVKVRWSLFAISGHSFKRSVTPKRQRRLQAWACAKCRAPRWARLPQALAHCPPSDSSAGSSGAKTSWCPLKGGGGRGKSVLLSPADQTSPRNPGSRVSVFNLPWGWGGGCQVFGRNHVQGQMVKF